MLTVKPRFNFAAEAWLWFDVGAQHTAGGKVKVGEGEEGPLLAQGSY